MAVTDTLHCNDHELDLLLANTRTRVNAAGATLRLYSNDVDGGPESLFETFIEPTFTGYEPVDLEDQWTEPARDEAGVWSMQSEIYTFEIVDGEEGPLTIEGVWIELTGDVLYSGRLPAPFELSFGGDPLRLRVILSLSDGLTYAAIVLA